jgi:hypothetical protein
MSHTPAASARSVTKKAAAIFVLHCLNPQCGGLLAYEVDRDNILYVDLAWTAKTADGKRYFPCPKCNGKNILAPLTDDKGRTQHRVVRWEP